MKKEESQANGITDNSEALENLEMEFNSTKAVADTQKEQLEKLQVDNSGLQKQITELKEKSSDTVE